MVKQVRRNPEKPGLSAGWSAGGHAERRSVMKTLWTLRKARPVCHWILCRVAAVFLWGAEASICQAQSSTPKPGGGTAPVQRGLPANNETVVHASAPITLQQLLEGHALATNLPPARGFGSGSGSTSGGGGGAAATSGNSAFSAPWSRDSVFWYTLMAFKTKYLG